MHVIIQKPQNYICIALEHKAVFRSWKTEHMLNVLKFLTLYFIPFWPNFSFFVQLFLKILSGMANSVDPDQTAPSGAV